MVSPLNNDCLHLHNSSDEAMQCQSQSTHQSIDYARSVLTKVSNERARAEGYAVLINKLIDLADFDSAVEMINRLDPTHDSLVHTAAIERLFATCSQQDLLEGLVDRQHTTPLKQAAYFMKLVEMKLLDKNLSGAFETAKKIPPYAVAIQTEALRIIFQASDDVQFQATVATLIGNNSTVRDQCYSSIVDRMAEKGLLEDALAIATKISNSTLKDQTLGRLLIGCTDVSIAERCIDQIDNPAGKYIAYLPIIKTRLEQNLNDEALAIAIKTQPHGKTYNQALQIIFDACTVSSLSEKITDLMEENSKQQSRAQMTLVKRKLEQDLPADALKLANKIGSESTRRNALLLVVENCKTKNPQLAEQAADLVTDLNGRLRAYGALTIEYAAVNNVKALADVTLKLRNLEDQIETKVWRNRVNYIKAGVASGAVILLSIYGRTILNKLGA